MKYLNSCLVLASLFASTPMVFADVDLDKLPQLEEKERFLEDLDLNDPSLTFKKLGGTTPKNWSIKNKEGIKIACLKCTSGNTNHNASVATYNLGKKLQFNMFPVAIYRDVDRVITDQNGTHIIKEQCALKEWVGTFTQYYWTRETFTSTSDLSKKNLVKALNCKEAVDLDQVYNFDSVSKYGDPAINDSTTHYVGISTLRAAARDFSNMMLMDVLNGNNDRFPGGNVFFGSESKKYSIDPKTNIVTYEDARFFSLDNEAGMKSLGSNSRGDLLKYVTRFDADMINRLRDLKVELERIDPNNIPEEFSYLRFHLSDKKKRGLHLVIANIAFILNHVENQKKKCGEQVFFD